MKQSHQAILWTTAVMLLRAPLRLVLFGLLPEGADAAVQDIVLIAVQLLLWGIPLVAMRPSCGKEEPRPSALLIVPVGFALQYTMMIVCQWFSQLLQLEQTPFLPPETPLGWAMSILCRVIVPAALEELFFRGMLYGSIRRDYGEGSAFVISSAVFALCHGSLAGLPAHIMFALVLGWCMMSTGNIWLCILLHLAINGAAVIFSLMPMEFSHPVALLACAVLALWPVLQAMENRPRPSLYLKAEPLLLALPVVLVCAAAYFV